MGLRDFWKRFMGVGGHGWFWLHMDIHNVLGSSVGCMVACGLHGGRVINGRRPLSWVGHGCLDNEHSVMKIERYS